MELISQIDPYLPEEDLVEVLIGQVEAWGKVESELLFPALEATFEGSEAATDAARERLNTLYALSSNIHLNEGAEGPFNDLAAKYIDAVKYHLVVDVKEFATMAAQLPKHISLELALAMDSKKLDLE